LKLLIVNFHYIREETYPAGIYPLSLKNLNKQAEVLSRRYRFISQDNMVEYIRNRSYPDKAMCLLTFDDGLKEQMAAFDLLQSKGIPAIYFVPTNAIQYGQVLDVHKLHYIRSKIDDEVLFDLLNQRYKISTIDFDDQFLTDQYRYDTEKARKIKYFLNFILDENKKDEAINSVFGSLATDEQSFADDLYMDENEIRILSESGALGSHGSAHIALAKVSFEKAENDIRQSVTYLENVTHSPVRSFSYPFGGVDACSESLRSAFGGTDITFALTMYRGVNNNDNIANPYFLNRVDTNDAPGGKLNSNEYL